MTHNAINPAEEWALVKTAKHTAYYVSTLGRCKTVNTNTGDEKITYGNLNRYTGYVSFAGDYVHRLVLKAFKGEPPQPDMHADHIDSNRQNCALENL